MSNILKKLATAAVLSLCSAASALAGSVTQPGETVGLAVGAPLPQGLYFVNTGDWGNRSGVDTSVGVTIPVLAWSTPWTILGGRVQFLLAGPLVEVGVHHTDLPSRGLQSARRGTVGLGSRKQLGVQLSARRLLEHG